MRLIIGDYADGKLEQGFHETGDHVPVAVLQELKGRFAEEYRAANIRLTEDQLLAAATPDQDVIQAIHALMQMDTALNGLGKYTTEWHQLHHPHNVEPWNELALRDLEDAGLKNLNKAVKELVEARDAVIEHIETKMTQLMPNTTKIIGGVLAAKLVDHAGSVERLARLPSNTIQLLGAERALFRFLRARDGKPPKHGVIVSHSFVQGVPRYKRGAMARKLANAIALAARVDWNKGEPIAERLIARLEVARNGYART